MKSAYKWQITNDKFAYIIDEESAGHNEPFIYVVSTESRTYPDDGETLAISEDEIIPRANAMTTPVYQEYFDKMVELVHSDEDGKNINFLPYEYYYNIEGDSCIASAKEIGFYETATQTKINDNSIPTVEGNVIDTINGQKIYFTFGLPRGPQGYLGDIDSVLISGITEGNTHVERTYSDEVTVYLKRPIGQTGPQGDVGQRGAQGQMGEIYFGLGNDCDEELSWCDDEHIMVKVGEEGNVKILPDEEEDDKEYWEFTLPKGPQGNEGQGSVKIMTLDDYISENVGNYFYAISGKNDMDGGANTGLYYNTRLIYPHKYFDDSFSDITFTDEKRKKFELSSNLSAIAFSGVTSFISGVTYENTSTGQTVTITVSEPYTGESRETTFYIMDGEYAPFLFRQTKLIRVTQTNTTKQIYSASLENNNDPFLYLYIDSNVGSGITLSVLDSGDTDVTNRELRFTEIYGDCRRPENNDGFRHQYRGKVELNDNILPFSRDLKLLLKISGETQTQKTIYFTRSAATKVNLKLNVFVGGDIEESEVQKLGDSAVTLYLGKTNNGGNTFSRLQFGDFNGNQIASGITYRAYNISTSSDTIDNLCIYTSTNNGLSYGTVKIWTDAQSHFGIKTDLFSIDRNSWEFDSTEGVYFVTDNVDFTQADIYLPDNDTPDNPNTGDTPDNPDTGDTPNNDGTIGDEVLGDGTISDGVIGDGTENDEDNSEQNESTEETTNGQNEETESP